MATIGKRPLHPFKKACVAITRYSVGSPDADNLSGSVKYLLDVMQPQSTRHPFGLGIIENDSADCITLTVRSERVSTRKDQKTKVQIEEIR